jgi:hypothetical protein
MNRRLIQAFALHCSIAACGGSSSAPCTSDDQCPSHFCKADGTCGPAPVDAPLPPQDEGPDSPSALCTPNHDGMITTDELPLAAGRMANFRIATDATWSTAGTAAGSGMKAWDLSGQLSGDMTTQVALAPASGTWWAADFSGATYATPLSASSDLIGVFALDATGLTLLGVVSPSGGATSTELTYDPPARILSLPFQVGSTWMTTSSVSGTAQGIFAAYTETYESHVDRAGTMTTPFGAFPVLRIATDMTRTSGIATLDQNRTFSWTAECAGIVATVQSQSFESGAEFSDDAEVRRLSP